MPLLHNITLTPTAPGYHKIQLELIVDSVECDSIRRMLGKEVRIFELSDKFDTYSYFDAGLQKMADTCKPEIIRRKVINSVLEIEV